MADKTPERYAGPKRYVEYTTAEGRTVQYLRYWHSPSGGQAVVIQFTDGTRIRIGIEPILRVEAETSVLRNGNLQDVARHPPILGAPVP